MFGKRRVPPVTNMSPFGNSDRPAQKSDAVPPVSGSNGGGTWVNASGSLDGSAVVLSSGVLDGSQIQASPVVVALFGGFASG